MKKRYVIDKGCKLCEACIWACPVKAVVSDGDRARIDPATCIQCGLCVENCANEAISVYETGPQPEDKP